MANSDWLYATRREQVSHDNRDLFEWIMGAISSQKTCWIALTPNRQDPSIPVRIHCLEWHGLVPHITCVTLFGNLDFTCKGADAFAAAIGWKDRLSHERLSESWTVAGVAWQWRLLPQLLEMIPKRSKSSQENDCAEEYW